MDIKNIYLATKGYKVYVVAICGLIYGISIGDMEIILASLAMAGFRDAMNK